MNDLLISSLRGFDMLSSVTGNSRANFADDTGERPVETESKDSKQKEKEGKRRKRKRGENEREREGPIGESIISTVPEPRENRRRFSG